ncbi:glycoside hydrolase family 16 protein [Mycobacterium sp. SMC-4]|uniref:glycoside hydrolase family 16 protein n=1 Tax=Mycobacterium sp. SMC-4 TaxID=2857059 RepID=UPI0021B180D0|nr:glycoside hydrolase family 16 protein [Mycobacterium sp. SMC-4]
MHLGSGKRWFAGGVVAAGIGAAMMAGTGIAGADTTGAERSDRSVSASRDSQSPRAPREPRTRTDNTTKAEREAPAEAADTGARAEPELVDSVAENVTIVKLDDGDAVADDAATQGSAAEGAPGPAGDSGRGPDKEEAAVGVVAVPARNDLRVRRSDVDESRATTQVGESRTVAEQSEQAAMTAAVAAISTAEVPSTVRVTVGSMIVDWLYSIGVKKTNYGPDFLAIPVPKFVQTWWLGVRARIYRDVLPPDAGPAQPKLLWETNFSSMEETLRYWGFQTGRWGWPAGENQYYTDGDNVFIDGAGNLVFEARRETPPDRFGAPYNYTSARLVTFGKQSIAVGTRVVARIQMPVTRGVLPAFWTVGLEPGHEYDWPRQGEIDIVEVPGFGTPQARRTWTGNIHGPADRDNTIDVKLPGFSTDLGVDLSAGFHEYGIDWHADRIVWHVDGVEVGRVTKAEYEALGGNWTPFSGAWEHYLILNIAVGNPWTGDPPADIPFQAQMKVDWVRAYTL